MSRSSSVLRRREAVFRAVADPTRRRMLDALAGGDLPAGDLASRFSVSRPAVAQHAAVLREAGLVSVRREGRSRIYTLNPTPLREIDQWLDAYRIFWTSRLAELRDHVERTKKRHRRQS